MMAAARPGATTGNTIAAALDSAARRLAAAGIEHPRLDARLLLAHALSRPGERFFGLEDMPLVPADLARFEALVLRRRAREPVSRIVGTRGFWTLDLTLAPEALDPRPDSETLIEAVLESLPDRDRPYRFLDLGTGTGCLLLSVLAEYPRARGLGIDLSDACVALARRNALENHLAERAAFQPGDWTDGLDAIFDVILCNPPYIPGPVIAALEPEVRDHDPRHALDGGADGLACYRRLASMLPPVLAKDVLVFLEIGHDQRAGVSALMLDAGFRDLGCRRDLGDRDRCLLFCRGDGDTERSPGDTLGLD